MNTAEFLSYLPETNPLLALDLAQRPTSFVPLRTQHSAVITLLRDRAPVKMSAQKADFVIQQIPAWYRQKTLGLLSLQNNYLRFEEYPNKGTSAFSALVTSPQQLHIQRGWCGIDELSLSAAVATYVEAAYIYFKSLPALEYEEPHGAERADEGPSAVLLARTIETFFAQVNTIKKWQLLNLAKQGETVSLNMQLDFSASGMAISTAINTWLNALFKEPNPPGARIHIDNHTPDTLTWALFQAGRHRTGPVKQQLTNLADALKTVKNDSTTTINPKALELLNEVTKPKTVLKADIEGLVTTSRGAFEVKEDSGHIQAKLTNPSNLTPKKISAVMEVCVFQ